MRVGIGCRCVLFRWEWAHVEEGRRSAFGVCELSKFYRGIVDPLCAGLPSLGNMRVRISEPRILPILHLGVRTVTRPEIFQPWRAKRAEGRMLRQEEVCAFGSTDRSRRTRYGGRIIRPLQLHCIHHSYRHTRQEKQHSRYKAPINFFFRALARTGPCERKGGCHSQEVVRGPGWCHRGW